MKHFLFLATFKKQWEEHKLEVERIMEMWDPSGGNVNLNFFCNKKVWRSWIRSVHDLVANWSGFEEWDWGNFSNVRMMGSLPGLDCQRFTICLLAFFIHSFVTHLGSFLSPLLCPPRFGAHSCREHAHKFGYVAITLPHSTKP